ncbi:Hypothetical protein PHPALM_12043 [Phytophthora palmivora]|uniref:Integrase catalytic domain-containing protein n=1 Tax=Phytophthora palmivora TaxID=4796 RepID=A0A2P4Y0S2_9STRA|nr:Hypothetical protein PHPALM_12043 [Phytophthora palmivora]
MLVFRDQANRLCMLSDASDADWGLVIRQKSSEGWVIALQLLSETHHKVRRNESSHWEFSNSFGSAPYVLVLKDAATHFVELVVIDRFTSKMEATSILYRWKLYGISIIGISDSGSHFKTTVIAELNRRLENHQEFILAYSPCISTVAFCKVKALTLEFSIRARDLPYALPMIQSSINHSPVPSLGKPRPIELCTDLLCPSDQDTIFIPEGKGRVIY